MFRVGIIGIDMIHIVLIVVIASTRVAVGQIMEIGKCPRIHILRFACRRIDRPVGRERNLGFLVFTFLGGNQHDTIGCLCSAKTRLQITLKEDSKTLDEVVVVGYGTQRKANLTGAVASVSAETLESRPITNLSQGLQCMIGK